MTQSVLVVDDDPVIQDLVKALLEAEGYQVHGALSGQAGLDSLARLRPDLVILDIDLGDMTGLVVCKKIRSSSRIPIIMLSAKNQELDKVVGMEFGADDYVSKPCTPRELVARVRAQLRRWSQWQNPPLHSGQLETRRATVLYALFGDDNSFEQVSLEDLTAQVLQFQEIFEQIMKAHGGVVDSYSEDTAIALFAEGTRAAAEACMAAKVLHHGMGQLSQLPLHIGLHSGALLLGDVSLTGQRPVLVGQEARKAATLARLAQKLQVPILASPSTVEAHSAGGWQAHGTHRLQEGDPPLVVSQPL
ncbi:MAG: response regulator [Vulcanimicrobiota bacterium]